MVAFFLQSRGGQTIWYKKAGGPGKTQGGPAPGLPRTLRAWFLLEKPQWLSLDHSHPSPLPFGISLPCHLSSVSALPAFRKRLKHHLFSVSFPSDSSPSTDITPFWCPCIHEFGSLQLHSTAQLTRSSWAPTISLVFPPEHWLHTGARVNVVLLTYLLT